MGIEAFTVLMLSRRQLLRYAVAGAAVAAVRPKPGLQRAAAAAAPPAPGGFLTSHELALLDAATARIIPTDAAAGARECGVVDYIQALLSFLPGSDANCDHQVNAADVVATIGRLRGAPAACRDAGDVDGNGAVEENDVAGAATAVFGARPVFAGGPFSGRQPQPHVATGSLPCKTCHDLPFENAGPAALAATAVSATVDKYPPPFFTEFLPLSRLQTLSWKVRILGASAVSEVAANPLAHSSIEVDLRNKYRNGLAALDQKGESTYGASFLDLTAQQQADLLNNKTDSEFANFVTLVTYHTVEGLLSVPEYGGNRNRLGWQLIGFDGDSQPLGYTIYDDAIGGYRERPDKPNSGPNPDETCAGFSPPVVNFLKLIVSATTVKPSKQFSTPYCLDVPT